MPTLTLKILGHSLFYLVAYLMLCGFTSYSEPESKNNTQIEITLPTAKQQQYKLSPELTVSVFPIPTSTFLHLSTKSPQLKWVTVEIINKNGLKLESLKIDLPTDLDLSKYKTGKYSVKIIQNKATATIDIRKNI
ncbi:MAG: T9SS type A sorting domain-containing protein [Bacteroidia bacterium]